MHDCYAKARLTRRNCYGCCCETGDWQGSNFDDNILWGGSFWTIIAMKPYLL